MATCGSPVIISLSSTGPGLLFLRFRRWLFRHLVLLSRRFSVGVEMPQPGIEPGSHEWARDCKSRLSANSSTGARRLSAETGGVWKPQSVSALVGPLRTTLNPSSCDVLLSSAPTFGECAKHLNDRIEQVAMCFGKIQWKLDKGLRKPWHWHSLKSLGDEVLLAGLHCASLGCDLVGSLGSVACRSRLRLGNKRGHVRSAFLQSL